jgi:hypothetical protein
MIFVMVMLFSLSTFANRWEVRSTCQNRLNFLGLVTVWSGENTHYEYDDNGNATGNTFTTPCTKDGNWDWAW